MGMLAKHSQQQLLFGQGEQADLRPPIELPAFAVSEEELNMAMAKFAQQKEKRAWASTPRKEDIAGRRVGRLTVLRYLGCLVKKDSNIRGVYYLCRCDCGKVIAVRTGNLTAPSGRSLSCGCWKQDRARECRIKLEGKRYGRLTVIDHAGSHPAIKGRPMYRCACDCGNEIVTDGQGIRQGATVSCGCLRRDAFVERNTKHGRAASPEYHCWQGIKARCKTHAHYAGRGIQVCEGWGNSFESFVRDVGPRPSDKHSIERTDNDGHYSCGRCGECIRSGWPMNCRWATQREQMRNTRSSRYLTVKGLRLHISEWVKIAELKPATIYVRLKAGMTEERAILTPNRLRLDRDEMVVRIHAAIAERLAKV